MLYCLLLCAAYCFACSPRRAFCMFTLYHIMFCILYLGNETRCMRHSWQAFNDNKVDDSGYARWGRSDSPWGSNAFICVAPETDDQGFIAMISCESSALSRPGWALLPVGKIQETNRGTDRSVQGVKTSVAHSVNASLA